MDNSGISLIGSCLPVCVRLGVKVMKGVKSTDDNEGRAIPMRECANVGIASCQKSKFENVKIAR